MRSLVLITEFSEFSEVMQVKLIVNSLMNSAISDIEPASANLVSLADLGEKKNETRSSYQLNTFPVTPQRISELEAENATLTRICLEQQIKINHLTDLHYKSHEEIVSLKDNECIFGEKLKKLTEKNRLKKKHSPMKLPSTLFKTGKQQFVLPCLCKSTETWANSLREKN